MFSCMSSQFFRHIGLVDLLRPSPILIGRVGLLRPSPILIGLVDLLRLCPILIQIFVHQVPFLCGVSLLHIAHIHCHQTE